MMPASSLERLRSQRSQLKRLGGAPPRGGGGGGGGGGGKKKPTPSEVAAAAGNAADLLPRSTAELATRESAL